jgi:hypothetical protein
MRVLSLASGGGATVFLQEEAALDRKERIMARIIVTADPAPMRPSGPGVLLDERVNSIHLCDGHAAEQLIERLAWAVSDAEDSERRTASTQAP